jgi:beta-N-acetylhexosaminidase
MYGSSNTRGKRQSLGFLMIGIEGVSLTDTDRVRLLHPAVAGVILFARNYNNPEQLSCLTAEIHALRHPRLLVAVDQEGGRVQRFKVAGFTRFSPVNRLGLLYDQHPQQALELARDWGWVLASELLSCGVDFSMAPVVDLDYGHSQVIGDRALHHNPHIVMRLAQAMITGMRQAGMTGVAKHFPGHGYAVADTHLEIAQDSRSLEQLRLSDMSPYVDLIADHLGAVMVAHVIYHIIDDLPAGLSSLWLQSILRHQLGFQGAIISDDLGMSAVAGRATADVLVTQFAQAGCDLVLLCNDWQQIDLALTGLQQYSADPVQESRLIRLHGNPRMVHYHALSQLHLSAAWLRRIKALKQAGLVGEFANQQQGNQRQLEIFMNPEESLFNCSFCRKRSC